VPGRLVDRFVIIRV